LDSFLKSRKSSDSGIAVYPQGNEVDSFGGKIN